jgi:lipopolysaccharide exporter
VPADRDGPERVDLNDADLDRRIVRGSAWVGLSYGGSHVASLLAVLVLARLLEPSAFGLVALAWAFMMVAAHLQGAGVSTALVYRRLPLEDAAGSAFVFSLASSLVLYAATFAAAPLAARAFDTPELTAVLRVLALALVLRGLGAAPYALLERRMDFRARGKCELIGALAQVAVSVSLAVAGAGVWSLVLGSLAAAAVQSTIGWLVAPFRPDPRRASAGVICDLVRYGRFVSGTNLVNLLTTTLDNLVVGRVLGPAALGLYSVAYRLADAPSTVMAHIAGGPMLAVFSLLQDDVARARRAFVHQLQRVALLALPASVVLAVAAEPVVLGLLGERWAGAVTALRILAVYGLVKSFTAPSGDVFNGSGRPQVAMAVGLVEVLLLLGALLVLVPRQGVQGAATAMLLTVTLCGTLKLALAMRMVALRAGELAAALAPCALCSLVLGASLLALLPAIETLPHVAALAVLAGSGAAVYAASTLLFARGVIRRNWTSLRGDRGRISHAKGVAL